MDAFKFAERLMAMDDAAWARHANPWSVYSRFSALPLLVLAIWSRTWLGAWALVPLALAIAWVWLNPRLFPVPERWDTWAAKGTLGERVFLNRAALPIPEHHRTWAIGLAWGSALGLLPLVWGIYAYDVGWTVAGLVLTMGPKIWFVDRMVWLYEDMADHPEVQALKPS